MARANESRGDAVCKKLLSEKQVAAYILKACAPEFADCSIADIATKCIEGEPMIDAAAVEPDYQAGQLRQSSNTEDKTVDEGTVFFDVLFHAVAPKSGAKIGLTINFEAQQQFTPGYPLLKRGVYYGCRLLSRQYGKTFVKADYGRLEKVYSIWICLNPTRDFEYTINRFRLMEEQIEGSARYAPDDFDLMSIVMLCLGRKDNEAASAVLRLLKMLLRDDNTPASEKKRILHDDFGVALTPKLEEGVVEMHWEDMMREDARAEERENVALEMLKNKLALPLVMQCTKLSEIALRNLAKVNGIAVL